MKLMANGMRNKQFLKALIELIAFLAIISVSSYLLFDLDFERTLTIIFGLVYVLFIPGFLVAFLIFGKNESFKPIDLVAISLGISIPLSLAITTYANLYHGMEFTGANIYAAIGLFNIIILIIIVQRRIFVKTGEKAKKSIPNEKNTV
jgi:uncharacterized membrane protein